MRLDIRNVAFFLFATIVIGSQALAETASSPPPLTSSLTNSGKQSLEISSLPAQSKTETYEEALLRGRMHELEADIALALARGAHWKDLARLRTAHANYVQARYESEIALRKSEVDLFNNQRLMEIPIFLLVLLIVVVALYLAHKQLAVWSKKANFGDAGSSNALSISKEGLTLNTPFVGLLMLLGAFAFFFMYIDKVYTIQARSDVLSTQLAKAVLHEEGAAGAKPAAPGASAPVAGKKID